MQEPRNDLQYCFNEEKKCLIIQEPKDQRIFSSLQSIAGLRYTRAQTKTFFTAALGDRHKIEPQLQRLGYILTQTKQRAEVPRSQEAALHAPKPQDSQPKPVLESAAHELLRARAQSLSIAELNQRIKSLIRSNFSEALWVVGEIADYNKVFMRPNSKGLFFKLIDKDESTSQPLSQLNVVVWNAQRESIQQSLSAAKLGPLQDGLLIRCQIQLDFFVQSGNLSAKILRIDPQYTLGAFALMKQIVWDKLQEMGLAQRNLALTLPLLPKRIALFTRSQSQAYIDFMETLSAARCGCEVTLFDINVQGQNLSKSFCQAYAHLEAGSFDLAVLTRGGGSSTDLAQFNDFEIAVRIAQSPLKFIIAIGHESDRCVLDEIATRAKTPTAAAQVVVDAFDTQRAFVLQSMYTLDLQSRTRIQNHLTRLRYAVEQIHDKTRNQLHGQQQRLLKTCYALAPSSDRILQRARETLLKSQDSIHYIQKQYIHSEYQHLGFAHQELKRTTLHLLQSHTNALLAAQDLLNAVNPLKLLRRGLCILKHEDGRLVRSIHELEHNHTVFAGLSDGSATLRVLSLSPHKDQTQ